MMNDPKISEGSSRPQMSVGISASFDAFPIAPERDYRDDLKELIDAAHQRMGITRYRICKKMGIESSTLSNVIAKRRHFSIDKLTAILSLLGKRIEFVDKRTSV